MKIFITITEEPIFINPFIRKVVQAIPSEVIGIGIVKGSLLKIKKDRNRANYLLSLALITNPIRLLRRAVIIVLFHILQVCRQIGIKNPLSITEIAERYNIPIVYVEDINSPEFIEYLKQKGPDIIINQAQAILKKDFISIPKIGCLNRHGALLPKYRGRLAPFWAYRNMEEEIGTSIHFIDDKLDSGPILVQKKVKIGRFDTLDTLLNKNFSIASQAMLEALELIRNGEYKNRLIENDDKLASYYSSPTVSDAFKYRLIMVGRMIHGK